MAMMVRVVFFIVAVVALHSWARFLGMIAAICIPWLAVLYANAGPVRSRKRQPSLYRRDTSALPDDPYPLGDGGQTIVEGEWTGPRSRRDRSAEPVALPPALPGTRSEQSGPDGVRSGYGAPVGRPRDDPVEAPAETDAPVEAPAAKPPDVRNAAPTEKPTDIPVDASDRSTTVST